LQWQMTEWKDENRYDAMSAVHPVYERYKDQVNQIHQQYAQQGQFIRRELILKNLLGEKALASASRDTGKARKQGQKKIEAQTTRPSSSKGDAASSRGRQGDTPEKRLAGVEI